MRSLSLLVLLLAACGPGPQSGSEALSDTCGARDLAGLVGQPLAALDQDQLEQPLRVLPPNSAMTMDHRPDRLNIDISAAGEITRLWCG